MPKLRPWRESEEEEGLIFETGCADLTKSQIPSVHLKSPVSLVVHALWFKNKMTSEEQSRTSVCALPSATADPAKGWAALLPYSTQVFLVSLALPPNAINRLLPKLFLLFFTVKTGWAKVHHKMLQNEWQSCDQDSGLCVAGGIPFPLSSSSELWFENRIVFNPLENGFC